MEREDDDEIAFYHESPTLIDLSPEDEQFMMNLSDVVGKLKPRGLMFDSDDDNLPLSPPPLAPAPAKRGEKFEIYNDTSTPQKSPRMERLKRMELELFNGVNARKKILIEPVSVIGIGNDRFTLRFHTKAARENPKIIMVPYLLSFPCINDGGGVSERIYSEPKRSIVVITNEAEHPSMELLIIFKLGNLFTIGIDKSVLCRWKHYVVKYEHLGERNVDLELTLSRKRDRLFIERVDVTVNLDFRNENRN